MGRLWFNGAHLSVVPLDNTWQQDSVIGFMALGPQSSAL